MKTKLFFLFFAALFLLSCSKDKVILMVPEGPNIDSSKLEYIWSMPLAEDTSEIWASNIIIKDDGLVFTRVFAGPEKLLQKINTETLETEWFWDDVGYLDRGLDISQTSGFYKIENQLMFLGKKKFYFVDFDSGNTLYDYYLPEDLGTPRAFFQVFGNIALTGTSYNTFQPDAAAHLLISRPLSSPFPDTVYSFYNTDGYKPSVPVTGVYISEVGDTMLLFQNRQFRTDPYDDKIDLYHFNLTADTLVWVLEDFVEDGNSNVRAPIVHDGMVFFEGGRAVYGINLEEGKVVWKKEFGVPTSFHLSSNLLVVNDILIVNPEMAAVFGVDPKTGEVIWMNDTIEEGPTPMVEHEGIVYFTSGVKLYAINGTTGETIWDEYSPNRFNIDVGSFFPQEVAIDPVKRIVYVSDRYMLHAIKMPE
jgi:outer membrane protein assembly factor BamB